MDAYVHPEDRKVRVAIEGSGFACEGTVHLPGIRLSDVMNEKSEFLVVVQATLFRKEQERSAQNPVEYQTLFVRKGEIKYVIPLEEGPSRRL